MRLLDICRALDPSKFVFIFSLLDLIFKVVNIISKKVAGDLLEVQERFFKIPDFMKPIQTFHFSHSKTASIYLFFWLPLKRRAFLFQIVDILHTCTHVY